MSRLTERSTLTAGSSETGAAIEGLDHVTESWGSMDRWLSIERFIQAMNRQTFSGSMSHLEIAGFEMSCRCSFVGITPNATSKQKRSGSE